MAYIHPDEELVLPKIEKVFFYLTERSQLSHVVCYLMNFIENASHVTIESTTCFGKEETVLTMDYKIDLDIS